VKLRSPWLPTMGALLFVAGAASAQPRVEIQTFDCLIEARQTVKLTSSAMGMVMELNVDRGDIVHKGQVLGKLDDRVEAANLALARAKAASDYDIAGHQARLAWLRTKFGRSNELSATHLVSRNDRDEAESNMHVEEEQLHQAEYQRGVAQLEALQADAMLAQRSFVSPVDGVVVERLLSVGEYRNDQSAILTLAQINPLRVEVFVPTADYAQIAVGSIGHVRPEQPVGGDYAARVTVVDKVIDAASGMFGVRLELPNADFVIPAGLKCKQLAPFDHIDIGVTSNWLRVSPVLGAGVVCAKPKVRDGDCC
jgi:RND family efflux transporter MFP subunit